MTDVGGVSVKIGLDASDVQTGAKKATAALEEVNKKAANVGGGFDAMSKGANQAKEKFEKISAGARGVAVAFGGLSTTSNSALGAIGGLIGSFAVGGPLGLGIAASTALVAKLGEAFSASAERAREAKEASEAATKAAAEAAQAQTIAIGAASTGMGEKEITLIEAANAATEKYNKALADAADLARSPETRKAWKEKTDEARKLKIEMEAAVEAENNFIRVQEAAGRFAAELAAEAEKERIAKERAADAQERMRVALERSMSIAITTGETQATAGLMLTNMQGGRRAGDAFQYTPGSFPMGTDKDWGALPSIGQAGAAGFATGTAIDAATTKPTDVLGNILGALIGPLAESFNRLIESTGVLSPLFDGLDDVLFAFAPILEQSKEAFNAIGEILSKGVAPFLTQFSEIVAKGEIPFVRLIQAVSEGVIFVFSFATALASISNTMLEWINLLDEAVLQPLISGSQVLLNAWIDGTNEFLRGIHEFFKSLGLTSDEFVAPLKHVSVISRELPDLADDVGNSASDFVDAFYNPTQTLRDFGREITNLPTGFKLANAIYAAEDGSGGMSSRGDRVGSVGSSGFDGDRPGAMPLRPGAQPLEINIGTYYANAQPEDEFGRLAMLKNRGISYGSNISRRGIRGGGN